MELNCELSPLAFSVLYAHLHSLSASSDFIKQRLEQIGLPIEWLGTAAQKYDTYWQWARSENLVDTTVGTRHALLASWILAGLRNTGPSADLNAALRREITGRYFREAPSPARPVPSAFNATVVGWTLGKVVGAYSLELPVIPARLPQDAQVATAYTGLVEHVVHLGSQAEPWPEMLWTSTFWRGAGLAEALRPSGDDKGAVGRAIGLLVAEARQLLPEHLHERIRRHWMTDFVQKRNVLTHVRPLSDGPLFTTVVTSLDPQQLIDPTIRGATQFVCQEVSRELVEHAASGVNAELWDEISEWDLFVP